MSLTGRQAQAAGRTGGHDIDSFMLPRNDWVPNNDHLPVLYYRNAVALRPDDPAAGFEELFTTNGWPPRWRWGVYSFHHYHSTAHEVLGVASGSARLMLGGPGGRIVDVSAGDVVVLPAGTGHRNLGSDDTFLVVGAYPPGQDFDLQRGPLPPAALGRMNHVPFPASDPVTGAAGSLPALWHQT
nr:cupin domain-containing protein [Gluconacetobacter azotocaptans]